MEWKTFLIEFEIMPFTALREARKNEENEVVDEQMRVNWERGQCAHALVQRFMTKPETMEQ